LWIDPKNQPETVNNDVFDGKVHYHEIKGVTSFFIDHNHRYLGLTDTVENNDGHTHQFYAITSDNKDHIHILRGETGPAIPLVNGRHYHDFKGIKTIENQAHHHRYGGKTNEYNTEDN
jgi:YmaF family